MSGEYPDELKVDGVGGEVVHRKHYPNLLNTCVFLVETSQQVSVMAVNYKGRPFMLGTTENMALLWSLALCAAGLFVAVNEVVPELNMYLGLVPFPNEDIRYCYPQAAERCRSIGHIMKNSRVLFIDLFLGGGKGRAGGLKCARRASQARSGGLRRDLHVRVLPVGPHLHVPLCPPHLHGQRPGGELAGAQPPLSPSPPPAACPSWLWIRLSWRLPDD